MGHKRHRLWNISCDFPHLRVRQKQVGGADGSFPDHQKLADQGRRSVVNLINIHDGSLHKLQRDIRIRILAVPLGALSVLDGELGAAVQTAKAQRALRFDPHRSFLLNFDSLNRAFSCT